MKKNKTAAIVGAAEIEKVHSGIKGLDDITGGGLPKGRPSLVSGGPGCGKTLFAMEFIIRGIIDYGEPGVFVAFEEKIDDLKLNFRSMGFDLDNLIRRKKLVLDHITIDRSEIEEAGEYDLEGLFIRLGALIDEVGAKRVSIDTLEALFSGFANEAILRSELRRLFLWLKDRGVTAVVTGERGDRTITTYGLEEYVADCVITLDHRVTNQIATRRLHIVKYRGSIHGTDEYPFLISEDGISVLPITSLSLTHKASGERIFTGIPRLDTMLEGKGFYRGSSILISGQAGTGKTSIAATFIDAACRRNEKCLFFIFEESESQLLRNMKSIGINLEPWVKSGLLKFHAVRPTAYSLEMHLSVMLKLIGEFKPRVVAVDPISNLYPIGDDIQVRSMLMRLIDFAKSLQITGLFTSLSNDVNVGVYSVEPTEMHVSSLMDAWLILKNIEGNGERNRAFSIIKVRGMAHSNQLREFILSDKGIRLLDVYKGSEGVLFGSARIAQEGNEIDDRLCKNEEIERKKRELESRRKLMENEISLLRERFAQEEDEMMILIGQDVSREKVAAKTKREIATQRHVDR
ncbi:putative circadian clock protein, KaiC [Methanoregula boonei 6A8]|jgi:circadian clock protein KaiC|uniref:non-specific serine/threonine protein kinase n=1 Tax=Methanoregula boonei (strain DSM 21154 / JCM 14090 / 6A8) TaxID=456442 RepID=A7I8E1_METB6|nr:circadian clock protein KaiC [Methanoregula boonei]ABS56002.1 putative circadian clock protein, KaiC [Methanoregula boonei 6A8]